MNNSRYSRLGSSELIQLISKGAMGEVYLAKQPLLNRMVAVKVIQARFEQDEDFLRRFKHEAQALAALEHPHIVPVYEYGNQDEVAYLIMPYISGGTLKDRVKAGPLTLTNAVELLEQLAAALDFAHQQAIIHRDIKPANVLLRESNWPLLADFGVAKLANMTAQSTNGHVGTPLYMAPEQWLGQVVSPQTDIYALGIVFYELLTGAPPFTGDDWGGIMRQHLQDTAEPMRQVNSNIPVELEAVVQKAIAKEPSQRYATAQTFAQAAKQAISQAAHSAPLNLYKGVANTLSHTPEAGKDIGADEAFIETEPVVESLTLLSQSKYVTLQANRAVEIRKWSQKPRLLAEWKNLYTSVDTITLIPSLPNHIITSVFGTLSLWKIGMPQPIAELSGHQRTIWATAITSNGKTLITGSWDRSIRLWDIEHMRLQRTIIGHGDIILAIALGMNEKVLLSGSRDGTIRVWELPAGRQMRSIRHPAGPVYALLYLAENDSLVVGGENGSVSLWNLKNGQNIWKTTIGDAGQILKIFKVDAQRLLCLTQTEKFVMLDRDSGGIQPLPTLLSQHPDNAIAMNVEVLSTNKNGALSYWNSKSNLQTQLAQAHEGRVTAMAALPEPGIVATGSEDHSVKIWEFSQS
jgi:serine/threonine protein kinase